VVWSWDWPWLLVMVAGHNFRQCGEFARVLMKYRQSMYEMIAVNGFVMVQMRQQRTDKYIWMSRLLPGGCIGILMQIIIEMKEIWFVPLLKNN
jgi:hypothetical protein